MRESVRTAGIAMLALLLVAGCDTTHSIANQAPRAQTPVLTGVRAALSATGTYVPVAAEVAGPSGTVGGFLPVPGVFRVLPSSEPNGLPRGSLQVTFTAPSLLTLKVDVEGRPLFKFQDVPSNLDPLVVGYYRIESIDASDHWLVTVRPPLSPIPRFALTINIATVSINPNFASGPNHESAPLAIKLASKPHRIGAKFETAGLTCERAPGLPRLRSGLTVRVADVGLSSMDVGCCHLPTQKVGIGGFPGTTAGANFPFPGLREFALVMKLGTQPPAQGGFMGSLVTTQAGQLELCMNDWNLADNSGGWGIDLRIDE